VVRDGEDVLDAMLGAGARPIKRPGHAVDAEAAAVRIGRAADGPRDGHV
jgi:hypothetical protein